MRVRYLLRGRRPGRRGVLERDPGAGGATPVQNVGAYGQDVSETIAGVTVWDRELRFANTDGPG